MKKTTTPTGKGATTRRTGTPAKAAAAKPLASVRPAAQKPVHATRAGIRRAVRAVATARAHADA
jgi:hypothetical protein